VKILLKIVGILTLVFYFNGTTLASKITQTTTIHVENKGFKLQESAFGMLHFFSEINNLERFVTEYTDYVPLQFSFSQASGLVKNLTYKPLFLSELFLLQSKFSALVRTKETIFPFHTFL
jgi:hypothetical protein